MKPEDCQMLIHSYKECLDELLDEDIDKIVEVILDAKRVFIMGNGGSASTASHFARDLRAIGIQALSLCDNIAIITSLANDRGYESVFKGQLEKQLEPEDAVIAISASGNSPNLLAAIGFSQSVGAKTIGFIGFGGGMLKGLVNKSIVLSSGEYGQVESAHLSLAHITCDIIRGRSSQRAVFVDRDGTIARDIGYCHSPDKFELLPQAAEAIRLLNQHGFKVIVITNQSGIARGYFTEETLARIHQKMENDLAKEGAYVDAIYYCPHHPDDRCDCRKPKPKLAIQAAKEHKINLQESFVVGNLDTDIEIAKYIGCRGILVGQAVAENFFKVAQAIVNESEEGKNLEEKR